MMLQAQARGCPEARGLGRLRQRAATMARARSRYSSFRWSRQNASVSATTASWVGCMALGTEVERGDFTTGTSCQDGPPGAGCCLAGPSAIGEPAEYRPAVRPRL